MATAARAPDRSVQRQRVLALALAAALALVGHGAWWALAEHDPGAFLPAEAAEARAALHEHFPAAEPPTVHILFVAAAPHNVVSAEALTAIAGLHSRLATDPAIEPLLAGADAISSPLAVLERHLAGQPGEWDTATVRAALANATANETERRALEGTLGTHARIAGANTTAQAMAVIVRLAPTDEPGALRAAEEGIADAARRTSVSRVAVYTDAPRLRDEAAASPGTLWVPLGTALLTLLGGVAGQVGWRRAGRWALVVPGGAGTGLLVGLALDQTSPVAPAAGALGGAVGLAAWLALPRALPQRWLAGLAALPLAAMAWAPAGVGALGAVASAAALATALVCGPADRTPRRPGWRGPRRAPTWLTRAPPLAGPVAVAVLVALVATTSGLPDEARPGWEGELPGWTDGAKAAGAIEEHFGGEGPGAQVALAAWGPVTDPLFLEALHETGERLARLQVAATGGPPQSVLVLAEDWATDEGAMDRADRYDASFAAQWANATDERGVPQRDVAALFAALRALDPEGTRRVLVVSAPSLDPGSGIALVRQRVQVDADVPRAGLTVTHAIEPLVLASARVAVDGSALNTEQARSALLADQLVVLLAIVAASGVAGLAWTGRVDGGSALAGPVAFAGALAVVAAASLFTLTGAPLTPLVALAYALAGAVTVALGAAFAADAARRSAEGAPAVEAAREASARMVGVASRVAVPLLALTLATVSAPAPALRLFGLAVALAVGGAGIVLAFVVPGLAAEWLSSGRRAQRAPGRPLDAHLTCPVCERTTATAAARCGACGRWNTVEACPAHPRELPGRCGACGADLDGVHFA